MPKDCEVIGIVGDVKLQDLHIETQPTVYRPLAADMPNPGLMNFVIYAPSFNDAKNAYLQTLREIAPASPELDITPVSRQLDESTSLERLMASLSGDSSPDWHCSSAASASTVSSRAASASER